MRRNRMLEIINSGITTTTTTMITGRTGENVKYFVHGLISHSIPF